MLLVPSLSARLDLILRTHRDMGHFGVNRVTKLLQKNYGWNKMEAYMKGVIGRCSSCVRSKATFRAPRNELQPLPIRGLGCRWGVDFASPFPTTKRGKKCVLVFNEHFTKWVELVPLPEKSAAETALALLGFVLSRMSAHAEVVTDQGSEFKGEF